MKGLPVADDKTKKPAEQENVKAASNFLRGAILQSFGNRVTASVPESENFLLKFHGTYMQDNRDLRDERARQRLEPAFDFMVRIRAAGGIVTPQQWLQLDALAHKYANGEIRLTTRQSFQLHGVLKWNLRQTIHDINQTLLDTLAACGDVNRNVMCNPNPYQSEVHAEVYEWAKRLSLHLAPRTRAYHEIWISDPQAGSVAVVPPPQDEEPMYGATYLPRKFKIAIAVPPSNDVDVTAHDVGLIAIVESAPEHRAPRLAGFNVSAGGGLGMTHGEPATFPNLGWVLGFCRPEQVLDVAEKILTTQRDFGDRSNRKHARLKYTILDRGVEWFQEELQRRLGWRLEPQRPFQFEHHGDRYGWVEGTNRKWHLTLFIENGRIRDWEDYPLMTGLRTIAESHDGDFRLTANQNLILGNIAEENRPRIEELVQSYKLSDGQRPAPNRPGALRRNAMACVALPTCGLAMAESERYLPLLVTKIEGLLAEAGLAEDEIVIRMTGCPNGCARPFLAEIGFVGKALGKYNLYLGADFAGTRLNRLYRENVGEEEILATLKPIIARYAQERQPGEHFGDFVVRVRYVRAVADGPDFHQIFIRRGEGTMNI
jgi:sulfite reductase (NADPH) hemoprotein beta-component